MNRRSAALGGALALSLTLTGFLAPSAPATASAAQVAGDTSSDAAAQALSQLRQDANGPVKVARDADGTVTSLSSTDGSAMLDSDASSPARAATETLADYGDAIGIDGDSSKAVVTKTLDSSTGGSVVRAQQVVHGVPVFGGQVVISLDKNDDVSSVTSATTAPDTTVPPALVSESAARATALGQTARNEHVAQRTLTVSDVGRRLYDPTVVGTTDPFGAQPVWQFEVSNGSDIQQTVLVSTTRGSVVLSFNMAPGATRKICNNDNARTVPDTHAVPTSCLAARSEGDPAVSVPSATDINDAYDNMGHVSDTYAALDGIDLTDEIGLSLGGTKTLLGTVRWCYTSANGEACPFDNAFWDGSQMVFGAGYASALDVVGHEMTHGYVDKTSQHIYFHEAGSINESVADTIGEIVDHRNGGAGDGWNLGEALPPTPQHHGPLRNMANPPLFGQPDSTQSSHYDGSDISDGDDGAVHQNDGVGNKTAYLISQGGTFGGQSVTGIDAGDPGDTKTGRLYLEMIPRLTSGADWVQYGQTLVSTCQQLVSADAADDNPDHPFTASDCTAVTKAVAATKLLTQPVSEAKQAAVSCPTATTQSLLARDDDNVSTLGLTSSSPLWTTGPDDSIGLPAYAVSGTGSRFALDPDPSLGDPASGSLTSAPMSLPTTGPAYLNFHDAYAFDWYGSTYYDGGQVLVQKLSGSTWQTVPGLPWRNGPARHIVASGSGFTGFGGDSHGFGSSQVDLSSLRGQTVRFVFQVAGDSEYSAYGWWLDDIRLYACPYDVASAPATSAAVASASAVKVSWSAPTFLGGNPITSWSVTASNGRAWNLPTATRSLTVGGLNALAPVSFRVAALTADGAGVPGTTAVVNPTTASLASSAAKVKKKKPFLLTARVLRRGSSAAAPGVAVLLQRKAGSSWVNISSGTTGRAGTKAWTLRQSKSTYYRVVTRPGGLWFGSTSTAKLVKKR